MVAQACYGLGMKKPANLMVRIDPTVKVEIMALAKDDDRSLARYIERVLRQHAQEARSRGQANKQKSPRPGSPDGGSGS